MIEGLPNAIVFGGSIVPVPPIPIREQACNIRCSFQGLTTYTKQLGTVHWWDPMLPSLIDAEDRLAVYAQKRTDIRPGAPNGDTHVNFSMDLTGLACLPRMRELIWEAITLGGMTGVLLMCMGDGDETNHDPGALGYHWLMDNFQAIWNAFKGDGTTQTPTGDLTPWIVFCPGYDGVIPAWQPFTRVENFARKARAIVGPRGYLAIELSGGYPCWSGEQNDWATSDGHCFDVVLQELPIGTLCPAHPPANLLDAAGGWAPGVTDGQREPWDAVWQVVGHLVDDFKRPAEMPTNDYPGWSGTRWLIGGTPRGPFHYNLFESFTYQWVRQQSITRAQIDAARAYYLTLGCTEVC